MRYLLILVALIAVGFAAAITFQQDPREREADAVLSCQFEIEKSFAASPLQGDARDVALGKLGDLCMRKSGYVAFHPWETAGDCLVRDLGGPDGPPLFRKLDESCWWWRKNGAQKRDGS